MFGTSDKGDYVTPPYEKGNHGFWPTTPGYRSVFLITGPGVTPGAEPEMELIQIASRLGQLLGVRFPE